MEPKPKSKWKRWHKIALVIIVLITIGIFQTTSEDTKTVEASTLTQAQNDSAARQETLTKAFSQWDGSQENLVKYVKDNMNDPESFEHVKTNYWDNGKSDTIIIKMTYRGKNAFGGVVTESVRAVAKISGELISVTQE